MIQEGCYEKTKQGIWVKSEIDGSEVVVSYQPRYVLESGFLVTMNEEGAEIERVMAHKSRMGSEWSEIGRVFVDREETINFVGVERVPLALAGVARHSIRLFVLGYGSSFEEIIHWFDDISDLRFLASDRYTIVDSGGRFTDLAGTQVLLDSVQSNADGFRAEGSYITYGNDRVSFVEDDLGFAADLLLFAEPG